MTRKISLFLKIVLIFLDSGGFLWTRVNAKNSKIHPSSYSSYRRLPSAVTEDPGRSDFEDASLSVVSANPNSLVEGRTWQNFAQVEHFNGLRKDTTTRDPSIPENPVGLTDPSLLVGPYEEKPDLRYTDVHFKGVNGSIVTAQIDSSVNISCTVLNRKDHETVSWIRLRDYEVLTVGRQPYSRDARFSVTFNRHLDEWILHLRFVLARDAGRYICQVSTHPPMVFVKTLTITEAVAAIETGSERIVQEGSIVKLNCSLLHHSQAPEYVFWYHNGTMINFASNRQVKVKKTKDGSVLTLVSVAKTDSGNYTCSPSNAKPASTMLHIILGDAPAAMQVSRGAKIYGNLLEILARVSLIIAASIL